jgi:hypothetical protein
MRTTEGEARVALPWLVDGERLDRATFHERYLAMPEETRAELIGGVVYLASPLRLKTTASPNGSSRRDHPPGIRLRHRLRD